MPLHMCVPRYDQLLDAYGVYKVETVGDCYVVAGGLITQDEEGFAVVARQSTGGQTGVAVARGRVGRRGVN